MYDLLDHVYLGNPIHTYVWAAAYFTVACLVLYVLRYGVLRKLKHLTALTENRVDDFILLSAERTIMPLLYFGAFYLSTRHLVLSPPVQKTIFTVGVAVVTILMARFISATLTFLMREVWLRKEQEESRENNLKILLPIMRIVLWGLAMVFLLDNLGFRVSAVITGLGIGGIAIAMASQAVLGDFFSYVTILLDKPFELGDFIIVSDGYMGTIEHLGIKTTRIRSLSGEQIIMPNSDLTSHRVRNYKRMEERRVVFTLGVTYNTGPEKMQRAVALVKDIITSREDVRIDRVHFARFGDFSLVIEGVYWILSPEYMIYMDIQQDINIELQKAFAQEGIEFAFPTQTLYVQKQPDGAGLS